METYLHYDPFMQQRDALNIRPHSATAVLRDKMLFGMFAGYLEWRPRQCWGYLGA